MSKEPRYGKGDRYRPVDGAKYRAEYDRIFGKRKPSLRRTVTRKGK